MPEYKLVMIFKNSLDKKSSMTISEARSDLTQAEAVAAMDDIIAADIFIPSGATLLEKADCQLLATTTSDFYDAA